MPVGPSSLSGAPASAVLRAQDLARAERFYADRLGLDVQPIPGTSSEMRVHLGSDTSICLYERPGMPAPANTTLCIEVADIKSAAAELRGRGVQFEEYDIPEMGLRTVDSVAVVHGEKRAWFKDSEGNIIVLREAEPRISRR